MTRTNETTIAVERNQSASALLLLLAMSVLLLITGCDLLPTEVDDYEPEAQLAAFLHNGEPVDKVILHWVGRFDQYYDPNQLGITGADIRIFPVKDADGSASDTTGRVCYFDDDPAQAGHYLPTALYLPEGKVRYRIEVSKPGDGVQLHAETTVPDTFSTQVFQNGLPVDLDGDTLRRGMPDLFIEWTPSEHTGGYQCGILALEDYDDLVPLDPNFDPTDPDKVEAYENVGKYSYTIATHYQYSMTIAWIYFVWAGETQIDIRACSQEYFDYFFSMLIGNGGENPAMNVKGGIGIFGATAVHTFNVYMEKAG